MKHLKNITLVSVALVFALLIRFPVLALLWLFLQLGRAASWLFPLAKSGLTLSPIVRKVFSRFERGNKVKRSNVPTVPFNPYPYER